MPDLYNKTALVTGGSRGIGRSIAQRLADGGARVAVHYGHDDARAEETVAGIERAGGHAFAVKADLGRPDAVETLFDGLVEGLGGQGLDILVHNAGAALLGPVEQVTPEDYERVFAVNARAPFFLTQRALPLLRDGGRIVFLSTGATRITMPDAAAYTMTKAAAEALGRCLALTLGPRSITVNCVLPGVVETDMSAAVTGDPAATAAVTGITALGRLALPGDVADVVAFLASDQARWITGQAIDVTGGMWLGPSR